MSLANASSITQVCFAPFAHLSKSLLLPTCDEMASRCGVVQPCEQKHCSCFSFLFWEGVSFELASPGQAAFKSVGDLQVRRAGGREGQDIGVGKQGEMEGQCQMTHQSLMIANAAHRFLVPWWQEVVSGNASVLLPSWAGIVPRLQPLSTYRLNLSEGREAKAPFVITWGRAAKCSLLDFCPVQGSCECSGFLPKVFFKTESRLCCR